MRSTQKSHREVTLQVANVLYWGSSMQPPPGRYKLRSTQTSHRATSLQSFCIEYVTIDSIRPRH